MDINRFIDKAIEWFPHSTPIALCCAASGYDGGMDGQYEITTTLTPTASSSPSWMDAEETVMTVGSLATVGELVTVISIGVKIYFGIPLDPWEASTAIMGLPAAWLFIRQLPEYIRHRRRQQ
jgi:hypothetical protein